MKILDLTSVTDTSQMPVKKGTLQFLQDSYKEAIAGIVKGLIGDAYDPTVMYAVQGVRNTGSGSTFTISGGAIFYNGELFLVDAAGFTVSGGNTAVCTVTTTQYTVNADPVTFSDTVVRNIHNIRKIVIASGASGSGDSDYSHVVIMQFAIPPQLNLTANNTGVQADNQIKLTGTYPNLDVYVPAKSNVTLLWVGHINAAGTAATKDGGLPGVTVSSVVHNAGGDYTLNHNIGHTNYYVDGVGLSRNFVSLKAVYAVAANFVSYSLSDDTSGNDDNHQVRIYGY